MSAVVHDSVGIVNAAANAIAAAESRVQAQPSTVRKRRWGNWLNIYWACFGSSASYRHSKRVGHAPIVPEPAAQTAASSLNPAAIDTSNSRSSSTTTIVFPFIAPPSSPASFLQSDPPSSTQTPNGPLTMASPAKTAQIYTIGPYAHETQLVSPPVFSTFTTEPSTACYTPPPEAATQHKTAITSLTSPEVPFAQLLMSSLAKNGRNSNGPSYYGYRKYYSLSQCEFKPYYQNPSSPGSNMSTSGTCSPFPDKIQRFSPSCNNLERQIADVGNKGDVIPTVDHNRVSFELMGEDIPTCVVREVSHSIESSRRSNEGDAQCRVVGGDDFNGEKRTVSLGSSKDFNFSYANGGGVEGGTTGKSPVECEWWTNEKVVDGKDW